MHHGDSDERDRPEGDRRAGHHQDREGKVGFHALRIPIRTPMSRETTMATMTGIRRPPACDQ